MVFIAVQNLVGNDGVGLITGYSSFNILQVLLKNA